MHVFEWIVRGVGMIAAAVMLVWFIMPMPLRVVNVGNIAGIVLCVWVFVMCCKPLQSLLRQLFSHGFTLVLYRVVNGVFIAFLVYGLIATVLMLAAANAQPEQGATALVLGAGVHPDGEPSSILRGRIRTAEKYLGENPESKAVLSGGKGYDEPQSEASCMYRVMTEDGVDGSRLYLEEKSTNTTENFRYSEEVIRENGLNQDITVVTDGFHQLRARIIYWQQGYQGRIGAMSVPTRLDMVPTYVVREWFAFPAQLFLRK